jgi:hypothetical protein
MIEDIVALLDEPGMAVERAVEQNLSTRGPKPNAEAKLGRQEGRTVRSGFLGGLAIVPNG